MLIGRAAECARIDALLDGARAGASAVLLIRGEPGIGKTSLCEYASERADGMARLRARGVESESELAFSGLADLFQPALDRLESIPGPQGAALAGALAIGPPAGRDRFTICAATLSLLGAVAEETSALAVVDDVHWLDASSAEALLFAARRLGAEGVALLLAARDEEPGPFDQAGLPELALGGLDDEGAQRLLEHTTGRPVAGEVGRRLRAATGGNPLALLETAATLGEDELAGSTPLETLLAPGHTVERPFLRRVTELPEEAQRALIVAAAGEAAERETVARALAALQLDVAALDLAEERGILAREGSRVKFRHPLFRSWVYHGASAAERRAAHRAVAEASGQEADRRAWHLAVAAAPNADEDVAAALEQTALGARYRGGHAEAGSALERAARLSTDAAEQGRRLLEAANDFRLAGQLDRALQALDESQAAAPALRVEAQHMRARVEMWRGAENKAHDLLVTEAAGIEESDPAKAAIMLTDAVMLAIARADVHVALATATAARKAGERAGGAIEALTRVALATVEILRGESQAGIELAAVSEAFQAEADPGVPAHQLILFAGSALVWIEEYERARRLLGQIVQRARAASAPGELPLVLAALADLDYRTGRWPAAYAGATEAVRLAGDTRQTAVVPYALTCVARIAAAQGREDDCRAHAERALELAGAIGAGSTPVLARSALGLLELGLGHPREAIGELEQVARMSEELGVGEPGVAQWGPDLIEAYVRSGDVERAQQALDRFNSEAERTARVWALAAAARCRGLLAPEDEFEEAFQAAFELHSRTPTPFERARSELAFGERLRRARRRADAREWLRRALETFQSLGAPVWMDRAHTELHASGETVRRREGVPLTDLTPQELQVALLVGEGATNREVGAALFLSPKTVEAHLSRIYRKLSIRSRTELARLVASEDAVVAPS